MRTAELVRPEHFAYAAQVRELLNCYEPPQPPFEDALEREAWLYETSGLGKVCPFVAFLAARGFGSVR